MIAPLDRIAEIETELRGDDLYSPGLLSGTCTELISIARTAIANEQAAYRKGLEEAAAVCDEEARTFADRISSLQRVAASRSMARKIRALAASLTPDTPATPNALPQ